MCDNDELNLQEQGIDSSTLILLKKDHLVTTMKMRLGSVLKFKAALALNFKTEPSRIFIVVTR